MFNRVIGTYLMANRFLGVCPMSNTYLGPCLMTWSNTYHVKVPMGAW